MHEVLWGIQRSAHRSQGSIDHSEVTSGGVERAGLEEEPQIFLHKYQSEVLRLVPFSTLKKEAKKYNKRAKARHLAREEFFRTFIPVTLDSQGRLLIPGVLRESYVSGDKVFVSGLGEYIKLYFNTPVEEVPDGKEHLDQIDSSASMH